MTSDAYRRLMGKAQPHLEPGLDKFLVLPPDDTWYFQEGGVPYRMWELVDPHFNTNAGVYFPNGTDIRLRRLTAYASDVMLLPSFAHLFSPNPLAEFLIPFLGGQPQAWRGTITLCARDDENEPCGLNDQETAILTNILNLNSNFV